MYIMNQVLDRSGADRYIAGNIMEKNGVLKVVEDHLKRKTIKSPTF